MVGVSSSLAEYGLEVDCRGNIRRRRKMGYPDFEQHRPDFEQHRPDLLGDELGKYAKSYKITLGGAGGSGHTAGIDSKDHPLPYWSMEDKPKEAPKKGSTMKEHFVNYFKKHQDVIFTLGIVILIDHFLFKGALRSRIQTSLESMMTRVEKAVGTEDKTGV